VICQQILKEEESKKKIEAEIAALSSKLNTLQESLNKKTKAKMEYDQLIQQTENAFTKVRIYNVFFFLWFNLKLKKIVFLFNFQ